MSKSACSTIIRVNELISMYQGVDRLGRTVKAGLFTVFTGCYSQ